MWCSCFFKLYLGLKMGDKAIEKMETSINQMMMVLLWNGLITILNVRLMKFLLQSDDRLVQKEENSHNGRH